MAKAGLGKGNAFAAPGPSYQNLEIERAAARQMAAIDRAGVPAEYQEQEDAIRRLANIIPISPSSPSASES